jgi:hypothetical protein
VPRGLKLTILPEKRGFYEGSLSVITTDLPSKKSFGRIERAPAARKCGVY